MDMPTTYPITLPLPRTRSRQIARYSHEIFAKEGDDFHAHSTLGFAQLPTGAAVEVEAIFEIK